MDATLNEKTASEAGLITTKWVQDSDGKMHLKITLHANKAEEFRAAEEEGRGSHVITLHDKFYRALKDNN